MRSKLSNALRKQFNDLLKKEMPQFKNIKPNKIEFLGKMEDAIPKGDRLYLWDFREDLYFYLLLVIATPKMGDAFTIEGAWTRNGRFPSKLSLMLPHGMPKSDILPDEPKNGDMRFRLGALFPEPCSHWWWLAPQRSFEKTNEWLQEGDYEGEKLFGPPEMPVEEAMKNVEPCVNEAINVIKKYAIPYFEEMETNMDNS